MDHVLYAYNGRIPIRPAEIDWDTIVDGSAAATLWPNEAVPWAELPRVRDPAVGSVGM